MEVFNGGMAAEGLVDILLDKDELAIRNGIRPGGVVDLARRKPDRQSREYQRQDDLLPKGSQLLAGENGEHIRGLCLRGCIDGGKGIG